MTIDPHQIRKAKAELDRVAETGMEPADDTEVLEGEVVDPDDEEYDDGPYRVRDHALFIVAGTGVIVSRTWRTWTLADYTENIRAYREIGDQDKAAEWEDKREKRRADRHARLWDWIELSGKVLLHWREVGIGAIAISVVPGIIYAVAQKDATKVGDPFRALCDGITLGWNLGVTAGPYALGLGALGGMAALWRTGMIAAESGEVPWLPALGYAEDHEGEPITPSIVVTALRDLGISSLRKSIEKMGDAGASMLGPIHLAGCGVELEITLPIGTSTKGVRDRHDMFAENMGRHPHEVFLTVAKKARTLKAFIADSGALDEPIGPSPLVTDTNIKADYYTGRAPWGVTLRGEPATISMFQQHILITGKSNQGKTASLRALMLWQAHDPTVEFRIADLKGVGDWGMFEGIATTLIQGPTDQDCIDATHMVEEAVEEMNRRIDALKKSGSEEGITREMARAPGSGFHPIRIIIDEAQKAYMCPAKDAAGVSYGGKKANSRYFTGIRELKNQGRAVNVTIDEGTQDPTDENLPKISREASHLRFALYVATKSQSAMALGEAPVEQGAAPHRLRDGLDRGTVIGHGPGVQVPRGEPALTIRTHFIDGKDAAAIADRIKKLRKPVQTRTEVIEGAPVRNILDDLDTVLNDKPGGKKIRLRDVAGMLRELAPDHLPYEDLTALALGGLLDEYGIRWTRSKNVTELDPRDFRDALERLAVGSPGSG